MTDGQAGYYVLPGDATGWKSGSAVRRRRSLYTSFAPSTPQNELPRGRLMSDLKAVSEPNPGKVEERDSKAVSEPNPGKLEDRERGALEGVRRNLFGGEENCLWGGTSTGGLKLSENGGGGLEERFLSGGLGLKSVTAAGEEGWGCASQSGQEGRNDPLETLKGMTAPLATYCGSGDNRFALTQGPQNPVVLSPLKLGPHTPSLDSKGQRKMRSLSEIEHSETVAKRRKTERTFEGGVGLGQGFKDVPSLKIVVRDGFRGWQPDGVDEGFKGVRSLNDVVKDGVRQEVGGWQSDGVDEGFKGVRSLNDVVKDGVREEVGGWQFDGVDAGFKTVRSLDDVVKTAVKNSLGQGDKPQLVEQESCSAKTSLDERSGFKTRKKGGFKEGETGEANELIASGKVDSKTALRATLEKSIAEIRRQLRELDEPQGKTANQFARLSDQVIKHSGALANPGINKERVGNPSEGGGEQQGTDESWEYDRFSDVFEEGGVDGLVGQEVGDRARVELRHLQSARQLSDSGKGPELTTPVEHNLTQSMTKSLSMPTVWRAEGADGETDSDSFDPTKGILMTSRNQAHPSLHDREFAAICQIPQPSPTPQPRKAPRRVRIDRTTLPGVSGGVKSGANPDPMKVTKLSFVYRPIGRTLEAQSQEGRSESAVDRGAGSEKEEEQQGTDSEWVECEACHKWRRLPPGCARPAEDSAWFCSMNKDPLRQVSRWYGSSFWSFGYVASCVLCVLFCILCGLLCISCILSSSLCVFVMHIIRSIMHFMYFMHFQNALYAFYYAFLCGLLCILLWSLAARVGDWEEMWLRQCSGSAENRSGCNSPSEKLVENEVFPPSRLHCGEEAGSAKIAERLLCMPQIIPCKTKDSLPLITRKLQNKITFPVGLQRPFGGARRE
jgi:hypothetical protein